MLKVVVSFVAGVLYGVYSTIDWPNWGVIPMLLKMWLFGGGGA